MPKGVGKDKLKLCFTCEGTGLVDGLGAYTMSEFDEAFNGDYDEYAETYRAAQKNCPCCKGKRVCTKAERKQYAYTLEDERMRMAESGYYGYGY